MYPGIDCLEIERMVKAHKRQPKLFERLFTIRELENLEGKGVQSYAARFAGKEAVLKTLGTGLSGFSWHDIEILTNLKGEPIVYLSARAMDQVRVRGGSQVKVSLTHNQTQAMAFAILE